MKTLKIRRATERDLGIVIGLIGEAARWLGRTKHTDQWARPWPSAEEREERVRRGLASGDTWIAWDGDVAAATITIEDKPKPGAPKLWDWRDDGPAVSVHRLVVRRSYAGLGLGAALLNWAGNRAANVHGAKWVRIDVWTTNTALHRYYERQGFEFVRFHDDPYYPSGALFRRPVTEVREVAGINLVTAEGRRSRRRALPNGWRGLPVAAAVRLTVPVAAIAQNLVNLDRGKLDVSNPPR